MARGRSSSSGLNATGKSRGVEPVDDDEEARMGDSCFEATGALGGTAVTGGCDALAGTAASGCCGGLAGTAVTGGCGALAGAAGTGGCSGALPTEEAPSLSFFDGTGL